jgi:beta-galactosidase GanA
LAQGLVAEHPATAAARAEGLVRDEPAREPATPVHRSSSSR